MKLVCSKNNLLNGLGIVSKAVPAKTTMSILTCILLEAGKNGLILMSNDMEMGIETRIDAEVEVPGSICLDASIFYDIVRKLPESDVYIETDESLKTVIRSDRAVFRLMGRPGEEYSYLPNVEKFDSVIVSQLTLKDMIRQTIFSIATNDNNQVMTGELLEVNGTQLKLIALDGHRVAIRKVELKDAYSPKRAIIPGKALNEISKILRDSIEEEVSISITGKHVMFEFDDTLVLSRLIDGEFFKVEQLLSTDYETRVKVRNKEFTDCVDRSLLFIREGDKRPVVLEITDNDMQMRMNSSLGSMNDELEVTKQGKDITIGFNPRFLIDVLKVIDDEEIELYLVNQKAPCFIKDSLESYVYMILPVNLPVE